MYTSLKGAVLTTFPADDCASTCDIAALPDVAPAPPKSKPDFVVISLSSPSSTTGSFLDT